jgi:hypothetical protein
MTPAPVKPLTRRFIPGDGQGARRGGRLGAEPDGSKRGIDLATASDNLRVGIYVIRRAIKAPVRQIAENAGADGSIVVGELQGNSDPQFSWNGQTGEYGDRFKMGVIDPAKVRRTVLLDAASIAGSLLKTEPPTLNQVSFVMYFCKLEIMYRGP